MAFDEAKVELALGQIQALGERFDVVIKAIDNERAEMGRRFELHGESIALRNEKTIKQEIGSLEARLDEKIDLLFKAKTAEQCADIESLGSSVDELKIRVDGIDTRTRDFPLYKGRIEQLENRPGQLAIKAWQKVLAAAGALVVVVATLVPWIWPKK